MSRSSGVGPHLEMSCETRNFSRVVVGNTGFISSGECYLGDPLELHKWSQVSFRISRGNSGLLSNHCRGIGPHLELRQGAQVSSPVATGISVFLSSFSMEVRPHLGFRHENSTFLSSCKRGARPPGELRQGTWAFLRGATWDSDLPSCCEGVFGAPFE